MQGKVALGRSTREQRLLAEGGEELAPVTHMPDTLYMSSAAMSMSRMYRMALLCVIICGSGHLCQ